MRCDPADDAISEAGVSYFCVGPVYATPTKPDYEPVGLSLVSYAARVAPPSDVSAKPWFAIGGINTDTIGDVLAAGARRACVVRPITEAADPQAAAQALTDRLNEAWQNDPSMESYSFAAWRGTA